MAEIWGKMREYFLYSSGGLNLGWPPAGHPDALSLPLLSKAQGEDKMKKTT